MKIELDNGYFITDDGSGYAVCKYTGKINEKTNKPMYEAIRYPSTLESALRTYARLANLEYEGTLSGYVDKITETINKLNTKGL